MTIKLDIHDVPGGARVGIKLTGLPGEVHTEISNNDAVAALEDLARILGYTLIDREERKSLQELVDEVDGHDDGSTPDTGGWQNRAEALSAAVSQALHFENDKEV